MEKDVMNRVIQEKSNQIVPNLNNATSRWGPEINSAMHA